MKLTKSRELRVVTGKFEYVTVIATVEADTEELSHTHQGAVQYIDGLLDEMTDEDINRFTTTAVADSFIHDWKE